MKTGKQLFEAYNAGGKNPWKSWDGKPVPSWDSLEGTDVQAKWNAVAAAQNDESLDVLQFMLKFGQVPRRLDGGEFTTPHHITERKLKERLDFLQEELKEFRDAILIQDMEGMADALVDLVYVAKGTAHLMNLPWNELWADVQRANMAKVRGIGARGNLVDCIKPPGWEPPNTGLILEEAGYEATVLNKSVQWDDPEHTAKKTLELSVVGANEGAQS